MNVRALWVAGLTIVIMAVILAVALGGFPV